MEKTEDIINLTTLHIIGLNSIIKAKVLYKEYMENSDIIFQNNISNYSYITSVAESSLPNSLFCELINNVDDNHQQQTDWMINELEDIKRKATRINCLEGSYVRLFYEKKIS